MTSRVPKVFQELVSRVMRSFYDDRCIIVMSLLNKVEWMRDEDIAEKMVIPTKDLHKVCGKLREEGFLHVITRNELKAQGSRPVPRTYYAVDYGKFINSVKYKIHQLWKRMQDSMDTVKQQRGYQCPSCSRVFSVVDALNCTDPNTGLFVCPKDRVPLETEPENPEKFQSQARSAKLMQLAKPIFDLLKETETQEFKVTKDTITRAMNKKEAAQKSGVKGELAFSQDTGGNITTISVTFLENDRASKEEKEVALQKKRQQNAMPIWFLKSTVNPFKSKSKRKRPVAQPTTLPSVQLAEDKIKVEKQLVEEAKRLEFYEKFYNNLNVLIPESDDASSEPKTSEVATPHNDSDHPSKRIRTN